jgi:anti-sigma regulatory factor (Ser/Thr protein kinase)
MFDLSLSIMDLAENGIRAEANLVEIYLDINFESDILILKIKDNGKGMEKDFVKNITNPFVTTRTTRKVGLGIPFTKQLADLCEGNLTINSEVGIGTEIVLKIKYSHIDRPPLGDIAQTFYSLSVLNPDLDFIFSFNVNENKFLLDTRDWREVLGDLPLNEPSISIALKNEILSNIKKIWR